MHTRWLYVYFHLGAFLLCFLSNSAICDLVLTPGVCLTAIELTNQSTDLTLVNIGFIQPPDNTNKTIPAYPCQLYLLDGPEFSQIHLNAISTVSYRSNHSKGDCQTDRRIQTFIRLDTFFTYMVGSLAFVSANIRHRDQITTFYCSITWCFL